MRVILPSNVGGTWHPSPSFQGTHPPTVLPVGPLSRGCVDTQTPTPLSCHQSVSGNTAPFRTVRRHELHRLLAPCRVLEPPPARAASPGPAAERGAGCTAGPAATAPLGVGSVSALRPSSVPPFVPLTGQRAHGISCSPSQGGGSLRRLFPPTPSPRTPQLTCAQDHHPAPPITARLPLPGALPPGCRSPRAARHPCPPPPHWRPHHRPLHPLPRTWFPVCVTTSPCSNARPLSACPPYPRGQPCPQASLLPGAVTHSPTPEGWPTRLHFLHSCLSFTGFPFSQPAC